MVTKLLVKKLRLKQDLNLECGVMESPEREGGSATFRKSKRIKGSGQEISDEAWSAVEDFIKQARRKPGY